MKKFLKFEKLVFFVILFFLMNFTCDKKITEKEQDKSAGLNGSFEIIQNNLPVNWTFYSPKTVPNSNFKIIVDRKNFKEGHNSLKFEIESCSKAGGWRSPGFTNEFFEVGKFKGKGKYKLSFWIKNDGAQFIITAGEVSSFKGEMNILINSNERIDDWKYFEYAVNVKENFWLKMQLNLLTPGNFWIEDIKVELIN